MTNNLERMKPSTLYFPENILYIERSERGQLDKGAGEWSREEDQRLQEAMRGGETLRTIAKHLSRV